MKRTQDVLDRRLELNVAAPVAVAFSGGSDSLALLILAKAWADQAGRRVIALTVDHGLQAQSGAWTKDAAKTATRLGVQFRALAWTGPKPASGIPAAARAVRHRLLADAAREAGASVILLGHTLDDQLENALMRGAGERLGILREWSPSPVWPEGRGLFHLRPLLSERRTELQAWLTGQGLGWVEDPANADPKSPRARARARIGRGEGVSAGEPSAGDERLRLAARLCRPADWGAVIAPRRAFADQGVSMRLLQIAAACAAGREALGRPDRARAILARIEAEQTFTATLGGARIEAGEAAVTILREAGEYDRLGAPKVTLTPGQPIVWDGRFEILAQDKGLTAQPLRGHAAGLPAKDRATLNRIAAAGRGALPAVAAPGLEPFSPVLAPGRPGVTAKCLVEHRFAAACGLIRREGESSAAHMADSREPSYVSVGAKGLIE